MQGAQKLNPIRIRNCFEAGRRRWYKRHMKMMRAALFCGLAAGLLLAFTGFGAEPSNDSSRKIHVLVVTGGHDFEHDAFLKLFSDNPAITFEAAEHPKARPLLRPESPGKYDVLVAYDMHQE